MSEQSDLKAKVNETFELIIQGKKEELKTLANNRRDVKSKSKESDGQRSKRRREEMDKNSSKLK
jgi:hypothetical protein